MKKILEMKFRDAMAGLPNVQPIKASQLIAVWRAEILEHDFYAKKPSAEPHIVSAGPLNLSSQDLDEMLHNDGFSASTVSPKGANLLIKLYEANVLPVKGKAGPISESLVTYASSEESFSELRSKQAEERRIEHAELVKKFEKLESIEETDFSYSFLDQLFFHHKKVGIGATELVVGGIKVTKYVSKHFSNSRENFDYAVEYTGIKRDGTPFKFESPSRYAGNRGNDPKRNWGLPE